jgi:hypothetical protein
MAIAEISAGGKLDNPRHERFAQLVAKGTNASEAYRVAYAYSGSGDVDNANVFGPRLMADDGIQRRVAEIISALDDSDLLSFRESRKFLADIVRTPVGQLDEDSPLVQELIITESGKRIKMADKLRALRLDAELMHRLDRRVELTGTIQHVLTADERARRLSSIIEKRAKAREIREA